MLSLDLWLPYTALAERHTVVGDLRVYRALYSPQLENQRDILVWLPPSYHSGDRDYPVIYMHDGQNLFDAMSAPFGEWCADESMTALAQEGIEAIVVGIPNTGDQRLYEYSPYSDTYRGVPFTGRGELYLRFLIDTVKPLIDANFRTRHEPASTAIAGSSMGGLISLYGFLRHPEIFGLCGAFSPAYWFGSSALLRTTHEHARGIGRVYLDVGTREGPTLNRWNVQGTDHNATYCDGVRKLRDILLTQGYRNEETLQYVEAEGALHNEAAWAERFPDAIRFLMRDLK